MVKEYTKQEIIKTLTDKYDDQFEYIFDEDKEIYKQTDKVKFVCKSNNIHQNTKRIETAFRSNANCRQCSMANKKGDFVIASEDIFGKIYDYSKIPAKFGSYDDLKMNCTKHNIEFTQKKNDHLAGKTGCKLCSKERKYVNTLPSRKENFINKAKEMYPENLFDFDYSKVNYVDSRTFVEISCNEHPEEPPFKVTPNNFLFGTSTICKQCAHKRK